MPSVYPMTTPQWASVPETLYPRLSKGKPMDFSLTRFLSAGLFCWQAHLHWIVRQGTERIGQNGVNAEVNYFPPSGFSVVDGESMLPLQCEQGFYPVFEGP